MYYYILYFIFGLIIGSFLNCLIWRLHTGESMLGRSHCVKCGAKIKWYDNIPLFSYLFLLGRCRNCKEKISIQYPIVELLTGFLFVVAFYLNFSNGYNSLYIAKYLFVISVAIIIFIYDLRWYLVLDSVLLPSIVIVFIVNLVLGISLLNIIISGSIGAGFFLLQFLISRGKWVGGGDIRIGGFIGVVFGNWQYLLLTLILAYFSGAIIGVFLIFLKKKQFGSKLPFGIFLSTAMIVVLFYGKEILNWYLNIYLF